MRKHFCICLPGKCIMFTEHIDLSFNFYDHHQENDIILLLKFKWTESNWLELLSSLCCQKSFISSSEMSVTSSMWRNLNNYLPELTTDLIQELVQIKFSSALIVKLPPLHTLNLWLFEMEGDLEPNEFLNLRWFDGFIG